MDFPSLRFNEDRKVLRVGEFAARLCCTEQHTIDLLEEGKLVGVDISGRYEYMQIPAAAVDAPCTGTSERSARSVFGRGSNREAWVHSR